MAVIPFSRLIGPILMDVILSEKHVSEIQVTGNPIETGAEVNDHAYVMPKRVTLVAADSSAAIVYNIMVRFQETRIPFFLITGLTVYRNMIIEKIEADRDKSTSKILSCTVELREVIIVETSAVISPIQSALASAIGIGLGLGGAAGNGGSASGGSSGGSGAPGGSGSSRAARPSPEISRDQTTADKSASNTVASTSEAVTPDSQQRSTILKDLF